jgi:hypothetical protein
VAQMPARLRMASPAATSAPPIQLARIGFGIGLQPLGNFGWTGHPLRCQSHQQAVAKRVLGSDFDLRPPASLNPAEMITGPIDSGLNAFPYDSGTGVSTTARSTGLRMSPILG